MNKEIEAYNRSFSQEFNSICTMLCLQINESLPEAESKIWHGHPVWFLNGNPVVGYGNLKDSIRLLFWSGRSFDEPLLQPEGKFKAAEARYTTLSQVSASDLKRWLQKSKKIQWDYKNITKRKGVLERLS